MGIKTSTFSGWRLSDEDAIAFLNQIENSEPNPAAIQALKDGMPLVKEYMEKGYVTIYPVKK